MDKLRIIFCLLIIFASSNYCFTQGKDNIENKILEERIENEKKRNQEKYDALEEKLDDKINRLDEERKRDVDELKENLSEKMLIYVGTILGLFALIVFFANWFGKAAIKNRTEQLIKTVTDGHSEKVIEEIDKRVKEKIDEEVLKSVDSDYVIKIFEEKGGDAINKLLRDLEEQKEKYISSLKDLDDQRLDIAKDISTETKKDLEDFIESLEKIKNENEYTADDWFYQGFLFQEKDEFDKAIDAYNKSIVLNPKLVGAYNNLGIIYANKNLFDLALNNYNKAIDINPEYALPYSNRGLLHISQNEFNKAIQDFSKAIELNPENIDAFKNRAKSYFSLKEMENALDDYNKAIDLKPNDANLYNARANVFKEIKDFDNAIKDSTKAIELNPDDPILYNSRGIIFKGNNDFDSAIKDYTKAIELNPTYTFGYTNRGLLNSEIGNFSDAKTDFIRAVELNENNLSDLLNLIELFIILAEYDSATKYMEIAKQLQNCEEKDLIALKYLECILNELTGKEKSKSENDLKKLMENEIQLSWRFEEIERWLENSNISNENKKYINDLTKKLKKYKIDNSI